MFDAFIRFANGIISHEASHHGGGSGGQPGSRGREPQPPPEEAPLEDLHLEADSLTISRAFWRAHSLPPDAGDAPELRAP
jgi:hypothetical protein